jgi:hypothetical protein
LRWRIVVRQAAKVIGLLTTVLLLVVWVVLNNNLPFSVGLGMNLIVIVGSTLAGLFAYVTVMKG